VNLPVQKYFIAVSLVLVLFPGAALADSLKLKDGREIKGEIIQSDTNGVLIEYFVTPTIKDEKTFSRDEIATMVWIPQDEKAYTALGSRATPQTVLDTSFYDSLLLKKLPEFFEQYPYSRHIAELREDRRSLTAERERVSAGDRRLDGVWFTAAQIAADPYQMGARIKFNEIKQLAAGDDPVTTLKAYELLEKNYPGSAVMPDALDLMPAVMDQLQSKLTQANRNYDIQSKKRQAWIETMPGDQAKEVKDALDLENQQAKNAIALATKNGSKFFPIFSNSKESLDQLQTLLQSEKVRLKVLQALPMRESISASTDAGRLLMIDKLKEAQGQCDAAAKLWPANADIATLTKKIDTPIMAQKAVTPTPMPTPTPKSSATR
jgi:hypothetical protein